jgi:hypothetical protein
MVVTKRKSNPTYISKLRKTIRGSKENLIMQSNMEVGQSNPTTSQAND